MKATRWKSTGIIAGIGLALSASGLALAQTDLTVENDGMTLTAGAVSSENILSVNLRVVGPNGLVFEERVEDSLAQWVPEGELADGLYNWEAIVVSVRTGAPKRQSAPMVYGDATATLESSASGSFQSNDAINESSTAPLAIDPLINAPLERLYSDEFKSVERQSGTFRVQDGWIIPKVESEEGVTSIGKRGLFQSIAGALVDFVFPSAHADCASPCDVDSVTDSDIHINAGSNAFEVELEVLSLDGTFQIGPEGGTSEPFRLDFAAPEDSLRIDNFGNIGRGTGAPTEDLHISTTIPRIRLEDTNGAQSWYVKNSNAGRFEIGEASGFSGAFVIQPGAPASSVAISPSGNVGIGTDTPTRNLTIVRPLGFPGINITNEAAPTGTEIVVDRDAKMRFGPQGSTKMTFDTVSGNLGIGDLSPSSRLSVSGNASVTGNAGVGIAVPTAPLHVVRSDDTFEMLLLDQANVGVVQDRNMMQLNNNGGIRFQFDNTELNTQWRFQAATGARDVFEIAKVGTGNIELEVDASGNLTIQGALTQGSDINSKRDIEKVNGTSVLSRLDELAVSEWSYKTDEDGVRHIGPMAQEFFSVFGLGGDDTKIAPADMAGIALAAIQAQQQQIRQQDLQIKDLRAQVESMKRIEARLGELEARLPTRVAYSK